jgi:hypothetical protein
MVFHKKVRRYFRNSAKIKRTHHKTSSISVTDVLLAGALYGAIRPTVSNLLPSFFNFGGIDSDNVILGGAGYFATKQSNKLIKSIGYIAMGTEAGIITSKLMNGTPSTQNFDYNY